MDFKTNTKNNFLIKLLIIILSLVSPFIMFYFEGVKPSLSSYWNSPFQAMFIIVNALTTYIFMDIPKWRLSGIMLFLLTIFSVEYYSQIHDIFAILFFVFTLYPLYNIKRYRYFLIPYLMSVYWLPNLLWFEVHSIIVLCIYHLIILIKLHNVKT